MHFDVTLGQTLIVVSILFTGWRITEALSVYKWQHKLMWKEFLVRNNLSDDFLSTKDLAPLTARKGE